MKKIIFFLILFLINNIYCWENFTPSNSPLLSTMIYKIHCDSKGVLWISVDTPNGPQFLAYENGKFTDYTNKLASFYEWGVRRFEEDARGNQIFVTKDGFTVYDGVNWEHTNIKYKTTYMPFVNGIICHDDKIFIFHVRKDVFQYFQYDESKGKYNLDDTLSYQLKDIPSSFSLGKIRKLASKKDSEHIMIGVMLRSLIEYNFKSKEWDYLIDDNGSEVKDRMNFWWANGNYLTEDNTYYLSIVRDELVKVDTNNHIDVIPLEGKPDSPSSVSGMIVFPDKKGILVTKSGGMVYIDNDGKRFLVPKPKHVDEYGWIFQSVAFDGKYIWLGTFYNGLYRCTLDELIVDMIPLSVEFPANVPSIDIFNLYPNPVSNNIINVEMLLENFTQSDLKMQLYDIDGKKVGVPRILEHQILNDCSNLVLEIPVLTKGKYFITFDNKKGFRAKSFVIE